MYKTMASDLVRHFEGYRLDVYLDSAGKPTVGVGHLVRPEDNLSVGDRITNEQAQDFLIADMRDADNAVDAFISVDLNDHQRAALVSWTYNLGADRLRKSTLRKRVNNKRTWNKVGREIRRWVYVGGKPSRGLKRRREAEASLWAMGYALTNEWLTYHA